MHERGEERLIEDNSPYLVRGFWELGIGRWDVGKIRSREGCFCG